MEWVSFAIGFIIGIPWGIVLFLCGFEFVCRVFGRG